MERIQPTRSSPLGGPPPITTLDQLPARLAWYAEMRETAPVYREEATGLWHVYRYADVDRVVSDYAAFSSETALMDPSGAEPEGLGASMIAIDSPRHRQLRGLVSQAFTPKAVNNLRPRIAALAEELLTEMRPRGEADLVRDFSYPLPVAVIAEMLGIPLERQADFKRWSDAVVGSPFSGADDEAHRDRQRTVGEMTDYFRQVLAERRAQPGEDLISGLLAAEIDGEHLTERELIGFCQLLLVAGNETTMNLIANAVICFDEHPDAVARLRREPELMRSAIEEVLRYLPPAWIVSPRRATSELELGGQRIEQNAIVIPLLVSANRDWRQFPEPDRFDVARTPNKHRAFGHGVHACLGAPLARLEAAIALPLLLDHLPELRVVRDAPIPIVDSASVSAGVFGPKTLPIAFTPS